MILNGSSSPDHAIAFIEHSRKSRPEGFSLDDICIPWQFWAFWSGSGDFCKRTSYYLSRETRKCLSLRCWNDRYWDRMGMLACDSRCGHHRHLAMVCGGLLLEEYPSLRQVLGVWWAHEYFVEFDATDFGAVTHHTDDTTKRKESESVHRKGVKRRLIVSLVVWWGGGMSWIPLLGATVAHSYRKMPHFGFQRGNFDRFEGRLAPLVDDSGCSSSYLPRNCIRGSAMKSFAAFL